MKKKQLNYFGIVGSKYLVLLLLSISILSYTHNFQPNYSIKTKLSKTYKPYTYWWWMGNAVDSANIAYSLESMCNAGIGGVHIIPIYGVKEEEDKFIDYLSPRWVNMVKYASNKASELGMDVDMTLGTGWCYGGNRVKQRDGIMSVEVDTIANCRSIEMVDLSSKTNYPVDTVMCILADYGNGKRIDLSSTVSNQKIILPDTTARATLYILRMQGHGREVKRAAPGAEGLMLNPLSAKAFKHYSKPFNIAFNDSLGRYISAIYHDSYEYSGADWSDDLFEKFEVSRGYRLQEFLPELIGKGKSELSRRIIADYRQTVFELHMEYIKAVSEFAKRNNTEFRDQAHGSPTNWLDTYAIANIPETESFGSSPFKIPKLERDEKYISVDNIPKSDIYKFASSAAHVTGKTLVSSETNTWLREHFRVALSQSKPELDKLFVSGINHIYYHGTAYSPKEATWPGWLFYASTNFAPSNSQYYHLNAQNRYVENCQRILQTTRPDNEIVVYFPYQDILHNYDLQNGILYTINVHNEKGWLANSEFQKVLTELKRSGFGYDYISDLQLLNSNTSGRDLQTTGNRYKTVIVPKCEYMPLITIEKLKELADSGVNILFVEYLPGTYSGYCKTQQSQILFAKTKQKLKNSGLPNVKVSMIKRMPSQLKTWGIKQEQLAFQNLDFIRKRDNTGYVYFISNLNSGKEINRYIPVGTEARDYIFYNPMTGKEGRAKIKKEGEETSVLLQLKQGQSIFLFAKNKEANYSEWKYEGEEKRRFPIEGEWSLDFLEGGPVLPKQATIHRLTSWTNLPDTMASYFSGLARYKIAFNFASFNKNNKYVILFDRVKESVLIRLNGKEVTTLFAHPFEADISKFLKKGMNDLELEVANLPANRIRYLDKQKVNWQKFYNINFVNINYKKFDASKWEPVESGLTGKISIISYEKVED